MCVCGNTDFIVDECGYSIKACSVTYLLAVTPIVTDFVELALLLLRKA